MTEQKVKNRWIIVIGALLIQLCLGAVYVWSVYNAPLTDKYFAIEKPSEAKQRDELKLQLATAQKLPDSDQNKAAQVKQLGDKVKEFEKTSGYNDVNTAVKTTFSITIAMFAFSTIFAGKLQDKIGPRWVATAGAVMLGLGVFLASKATSPTQLWLFYGVLGGAGIGTAYVCPLATCLKWFPDKRGLITGLAVGGFGAASVIFAPVSQSLLEAFKVDQTFMILSLIYVVVVALGSQLLEVPPPGYKPEGWTPPAPAAGAASGGDFTTGQMMKTIQFFFIWFMYLFGAAAGLMVIGNAAGLAKDFGGWGAKATVIVMVIGVFNAAGRLIWGIVSDKLGRVNTLMVLYGLTALTFVYLMMAPTSVTPPATIAAMSSMGFLVACCLIAFCFGGFLAVYPSLNAEYYGTANVGTNYGIIFFAYGLGAVLGMKLLDMLASAAEPGKAFVAMAVLSAVGLVMCFAIRKAPELKA